MSFRNDLADANAGWSSIKGKILEMIRGDDLIDIESKDSELSNLFDQYSGIDAIQIVNRQLRGVAIRVQWGSSWDTFTIRFQRSSGAITEYEKRTKAIFSNNGFWYPYLTIQIYLKSKSDNQVLSIGVVKTIDLYQYIFCNMPRIKKQTCKNDGNVFLVVSFNELKNNGANILIG